jgi:hypothetical protein
MANIQTTAEPSLIGKYINEYLWSDVNPVGKIIGVKGKSTLILARVGYTRDETVKMEFIPGGFSAHCVNNHSQKWIYSVDEKDTFTVRLSKSFLRRNRIEDKPYHFYDFNF